MRARVASRGYANSFESLRASVPWRPLLVDESGARTSVRPLSDHDGKIPLRQGFSPDRLKIRVVGRASGGGA